MWPESRVVGKYQDGTDRMERVTQKAEAFVTLLDFKEEYEWLSG